MALYSVTCFNMYFMYSADAVRDHKMQMINYYKYVLWTQYLSHRRFLHSLIYLFCCIQYRTKGETIIVIFGRLLNACLIIEAM